jgi:hypothetical protein
MFNHVSIIVSAAKACHGIALTLSPAETSETSQTSQTSQTSHLPNLRNLRNLRRRAYSACTAA